MGKNTMPGRDLKHYDTYLQKIELYAKAIGIKIVYNKDESAYIPNKRIIKVDSDLSHSYEVASLLHELGHALDEHLVNKKLNSKILTAYDNEYDKRSTRKQHNLVMQCERRAWKYGRIIAKKLRIRLGAWYTEAERDCLSSYRE